MQPASYHNHTTWSDGRGSVAEMIAAGAALGVAEVGISDHLVIPAAGPAPAYAIDPRRLDDYFNELQAAREHAPVPFRIGVEVDWFPDARERIVAALADRPLDFVIGSVHEVGHFTLDATPVAWDRLEAEARDEMHRGYWRLTADMARSGLFDIAAHLDLPRKFGHRASIDLGEEIDATLDAIAEADMVVELNTAGWHKPCRDAYPGASILERCRERDIPVMLSADAHDPAHLVRDFDRGTRRLRGAGYEEIVQFLRRERTTVKL